MNLSRLKKVKDISSNGNIKKLFKEKYKRIFAIELGLSSDTHLADTISELGNKNFLTNSIRTENFAWNVRN